MKSIIKCYLYELSFRHVNFNDILPATSLIDKERDKNLNFFLQTQVNILCVITHDIYNMEQIL